MPAAQAARKRTGAYYTPEEFAAMIAGRLVGPLGDAEWGCLPSERPIRVVDPACGDGRLLAAVAEALAAHGLAAELYGCDIDGNALDAIRVPDVTTIHADALAHDWQGQRFDIVIGNPPFLSQMAATSTRGGASRHGGGPYADAAAEFLALATRLADSAHGRIALILPQSILGARDARPIRDEVDRLADLVWSWWSPDQRLFDAQVNVCVVALRRPSTGAATVWTRVVTDALGIPLLDARELDTDGTIGDRAMLNANFRDEYYALVPAVADDADGPPLVTSGLIDPARCRWGERPVTFNKCKFDRPRVDVSRLEGRFRAWAARKLVPKVLVANQTRVVEAVADVDGAWLPGVPVTTIVPVDPCRAIATCREVEALLCSPIASILCWQEGAGTGLSPRTVRVSPAVLGAIPWPAGDLGPAVVALADGDVVACARAVLDAYAVAAGARDPMLRWWDAQRPAGTDS